MNTDLTSGPSYSYLNVVNDDISEKIINSMTISYRKDDIHVSLLNRQRELYSVH